MEFALINFRVTQRERQALRVELLKEGKTLQEFFASVVRQKLDGRFWPDSPGEEDVSHTRLVLR